MDVTSQTFAAFLEQWLINKQHHLHILVGLMHSKEFENEQRCKEVINTILAHYEDYFEAKVSVVLENAFLALTPPWFTSLERSYFWMGDFRPTLACSLAAGNILDLTEDQAERIHRLMDVVSYEESVISHDLARAQENMVNASVIEMMRNSGGPRNGEVHVLESVVEDLRVSSRYLVECADILRKNAVLLLVEILKPSQGVTFLACAVNLQLTLRRWGIHGDSEQGVNPSA